MTTPALPHPHMDRGEAVVVGRFAIFGAAVATAWELVGTVGQFVIVAAAFCAAIGFFYAKMVRPAVKATLRAWHAVDALEELPALNERVKQIESTLVEIVAEDRAGARGEIERRVD
jgi:hypothetical protein